MTMTTTDELEAERKAKREQRKAFNLRRYTRRMRRMRAAVQKR